MQVRRRGVFGTAALLLAALVGAAIGYAVGSDRPPLPTAFAAAPIPASAPSSPVIPPVVLPDDVYPPLEPGVRTRQVRVGMQPFQVALPIPRGWFRSDSAAGEWRWYPAPDRTKNLFFIRVSQVSNTHQSVSAALTDRIEALREAAGVDEFALESQRSDRFLATYVAFKHRRVNFEGYLPRGGTAYLRIAVIGREIDRAGLAALFDRLMTQTRV